MKEYALVDSKKVANGEYPYVYVCENGEVRELSEDECEYLETKFYPTDGARPYVKYRYEDLTPDGSIKGYLSRKAYQRFLQKGSSKKSVLSKAISVIRGLVN